MPSAKHHAEWLSLIEVSGPFLTLPVLEKVFPQGLDAHDPETVRNLRAAFDEWETNQTGRRANPAIHKAWIDFVLKQTLGLPDEVLAEGQAIPQTLKATVAGQGETLRPDTIVRNPEGGTDPGKPRLLVQIYPENQDLGEPISGRHWKASPATRMMELLHSTDVRLGLATNGEQWMLVDAPRGETTGFASWYATLWFEEPLTLRALRSLLGVHRFFAVADSETLEAMLKESAAYQNEVTDQLGLQVRRAVEVLIQSLDRADQDHQRALLKDLPETTLYESALTVMMRLVFLFSAEERGLLLLGDPLFDQHYAVSTLVAQLQETADQYGEEVLERRYDAWVRLLSTFRAVFGGVQHERMKLPAYAGNLFNPDRFCFLEGRKSRTSWKTTPANPLPIDNRTVLHLLRSLQYLEMQGEARRLSFRALDIEQIGYVYEGLLDHTAKRAAEPMIGLFGAKGIEPEVALSEIERLFKKGEADLLTFLVEETKRSDSALKRALEVPLDGDDAKRLKATSGTDDKLFERVRPFSGLLRNDTFGRPVVIRKGSVFVTTGTGRRSSGTYYTPRSLTEPIVRYTLEPLIYEGPGEGKPNDDWTLRSAKGLLDLKICDMACGSGAFLVQACRYLSERLLEAWEDAEKLHPAVPGITPDGEASTGATGELLIPKDTNERLVYARRILAQRCLYGVDKNPLAVEMAKLSLWLLTVAKDKPFTFLDHCIRCGDSLVGINSLEQLLRFSMSEKFTTGPLLEQQRKQIENRLNAAKLLRKQIEEQPSNTSQDIERKAAMLANAEEQTHRLTYAADLLLAATWQPMTDPERETALNSTLVGVEYKFKDLPIKELDIESKNRLDQAGVGECFHWPLEFPEAFEKSGFDAFIGNPPFLGGRRIRSTLGADYLRWLTTLLCPGSSGNADLCSFFFRRAAQLLQSNGAFGLLATNTIAQGDTRGVGLDPLLDNGFTITRAVPSRKWPGTANLEVAHIWMRRGGWNGRAILDDQPVKGITSYLADDDLVTGHPYRLAANIGKSFQGSIVLGMGFVLTSERAMELIARNPKNRDVLFPYLNGDDLNSRPDQSPSRWVINFSDWPVDRASAPSGYEGHVAADYPDCLSIVEENVKPERQRRKRNGDFQLRKPLPQKWWIYADKRPALYALLKTRDTVMVSTRVTKFLCVSTVPTNIVFSVDLAVHAGLDNEHSATLSSSLFEIWTRESSSTMETRLRFSITDSVEPFPLPLRAVTPVLGEQYLEHRKSIMAQRQEGLTKTYNRFHDHSEMAKDIRRLRDLHVEMDKAVAAAYGWDGLDLGHGFHETKQGVRFTTNEPARREILQRLLKLNHERYAEEVEKGLHDKNGKAKRSTGARANRKRSDSNGPALFGEDAQESDAADGPTDAETARSSAGRHSASRAAAEAGRVLSAPINEAGTDEIMACFRQAARGRGWMNRETVLKEVSLILGYQRLGSKVEEALKNHLRAAIRRRIIEADGSDLVRGATSNLGDYSLDELRDFLCSVMRTGTTYEREEVIDALAHHLGFARVTDTSRDVIKSALNSAIRQGLLGYEGSVVWRNG